MTWITVPCSSSARSWSAAAVLRVAGGVFYGLGDPPSETLQMAEESSEETSETDEGKQRTPLTMIVPPAVLVAAAAAIGLLPHLGSVRAGGRGAVPGSGAPTTPPSCTARTIAHVTAPYRAEPAGVTVTDVVIGLGTAAGAVVLAFLALYWRRLPLLRRGFEPGTGLVRPAAAFPERGGQRLRHLDRDRGGLPGRRPGLLDPLIAG